MLRSVGSRCEHSPSLIARAGERAAGVDDLQLDLAKGEAQVGVSQQRARQQVRLAQHLEAVADPQHQPPSWANSITDSIAGEKRAIAPARR